MVKGITRILGESDRSYYLRNSQRIPNISSFVLDHEKFQFILTEAFTIEALLHIYPFVDRSYTFYKFHYGQYF